MRLGDGLVDLELVNERMVTHLKHAAQHTAHAKEADKSGLSMSG